MLTLSEITAKYKRTPKTFKKHVLKHGVPFELLGRSMMFDPVAVSNHLASLRPVDPEPKRTQRTSRKKVRTNRFAEMLGI